jgi:antitoxin (DNA-binding transcriptional repressor) of toxin-antitoxin stability system
VLQSKHLQHISERFTMKELNVREMRAAIGRLDDLVASAGELIVSRRGKAIARILPVSRRQPRPDHADLRARMPRLSSPSAALIRDERDER